MLLTGLPEILKLRVQEAIDSIHCWHQAWGGRIYISFSGGKDSKVVEFIVSHFYPGIPLHYVNTGLEYPEIVVFVRKHNNVVEVRPKKPFRWVLEHKGYPLVSKKVAKSIRTLRNPSDKNARIRNLFMTGINSSGNSCEAFRLAKKWYPLITAPFSTSDQCCDIIKKEPLHRLQKQTGRMPIIGIMLSDSSQRKMGMGQQAGCNLYDSKHPISRPLKNWTEQNVLEFIYLKKIPIAPVYGEVIRMESGEYKTTGEQRTGCMFCAFGAHLEKSPNRFERMKISHPQHYSVCMNQLGMREPLQYIGVPV